MQSASSILRTAAICFAVCQGCSGQTPDLNPSSSVRPLPDVAALMQHVEENEKASEAIMRNYIYTSTIEGMKLDNRGDLKKEMTTEMEVFYIDGVRLQRVTKRGGKELSPEEQKKEAERIDKEIAKARDKRGKILDEEHNDQISFARFLQLGTFSNERRVMLRGRPTIALDYTGDPKAATHNRLEGVVHDMAGTVWVDEQDAALSRVEGHFTNTFKVGGGLVAYVAKDTAFVADSAFINGEVWLPATFSANGSMHVLLFFSFNGRVSGTNTNYRRFKANSRILPGVQQTDSPAAEPPAKPHETKASPVP